MADLTSILSDEGDKPADVPVVETVEAPEQTQEPAAEATGEQAAATPAETQETNDSAKVPLAALMAERAKRQELEAQWREYQSNQAKAAPQQQAALEEAPNPANYTDTVKYLEDVAEFKADQKLKQWQRDQARANEEKQQQEKHTALVRAQENTIEAGRSEFTDFDASINQGLAPFLNPVLHQAIVSTKEGHKVAYFLSKNPAEAARISQLEPMEMLVELGALRSRATVAPKPVIPRTLTQERDTRGQFSNGAAWDGPTPLDALFARK